MEVQGHFAVVYPIETDLDNMGRHQQTSQAFEIYDAIYDVGHRVFPLIASNTKLAFPATTSFLLILLFYLLLLICLVENAT